MTTNYKEKMKGWKPSFGNETDIQISRKVGEMEAKKKKYFEIVEQNSTLRNLREDIGKLEEEILFLAKRK